MGLLYPDDQAIYGLAHKAGLAVVDATETIHAFHQTDEAGNHAGKHAEIFSEPNAKHVL